MQQIFNRIRYVSLIPKGFTYHIRVQRLALSKEMAISDPDLRTIFSAQDIVHRWSHDRMAAYQIIGNACDAIDLAEEEHLFRWHASWTLLYFIVHTMRICTVHCIVAAELQSICSTLLLCHVDMQSISIWWLPLSAAHYFHHRLSIWQISCVNYIELCGYVRHFAMQKQCLIDSLHRCIGVTRKSIFGEWDNTHSILWCGSPWSFERRQVTMYVFIFGCPRCMVAYAVHCVYIYLVALICQSNVEWSLQYAMQ